MLVEDITDEIARINRYKRGQNTADTTRTEAGLKCKFMGSVKDLEIMQKPTRDATGIGRFHFSDRYSVFDWGEMPDLIEHKGEALCIMGAYCFEQLEYQGMRTHYCGLVDEDGKTVKFNQLKQPSRTMEVQLVNVYEPETCISQGNLAYDYSFYKPTLTNCLIPLEIIYRNGLPEGSSVFNRLDKGSATLKDLGLNHYPKPGESLATPLFDVSTKLEQADRYLTWKEAQEIAGLTDQEIAEIKAVLERVDGTISEIAAEAKLKNEDGKIELAFDADRKLMVVDVVGTLDECRFTYNGFHVSKEIARQFYKKTDWYTDLEEGKKTAEARRILDWRSLCKCQPPKLDPQLKTIISQMYMSTANELTHRMIFASPHLAQVIESYKSYIGEEKG